jgi:hypothetical protein
MAFSKPASQRELDFIRANWKTMKVADIASELGRGERFVYKKINDMHLRDGPAPAEAPPMQPKPERGRMVHVPARPKRGSLSDLADVVWSAVLAAEPGQLPKLSEEYRRIMEEMKGDDEKGASAGERPIAEIIRLARDA